MYFSSASLKQTQKISKNKNRNEQNRKKNVASECKLKKIT